MNEMQRAVSRSGLVRAREALSNPNAGAEGFYRAVLGYAYFCAFGVWWEDQPSAADEDHQDREQARVAGVDVGEDHDSTVPSAQSAQSCNTGLGPGSAGGT